MKKIFLLNIKIFLLIILIAGACDHKSGAPRPAAAIAPQPSGKTGEQLAVIYCAGCHLYPEPALLDKTTWEAELLPDMGCRLGIRTPGYDPYRKLSGVADFDLDGDWDIAAASFFPGDPTRAGDCFVYLEQTQTLNFQAFTFKGATAGRWLTMDTGDIDRDGDPDIILGSYLDRESQGLPQWKHVDRRMPFLLLENNRK